MNEVIYVTSQTTSWFVWVAESAGYLRDLHFNDLVRILYGRVKAKIDIWLVFQCFGVALSIVYWHMVKSSFVPDQRFD